MFGEPFVGTGTIWLESLKFERVKAVCSDIAVETILLVRDNLDFFRQDVEALDVLVKQLTQLQRHPESVDHPSQEELLHYRGNIIGAYEWAREHIGLLTSDHPTDRVKLFEMLSGKALFDRVVFYVALRTQLRHMAAFERESEDWATAFFHELQELNEQITKLAKLRLRERNSKAKGHAGLESMAFFQGRYSVSCSMSVDTLSSCSETHLHQSIKRGDVCNLPKDTFDIIVTDPPYGFNTDGDAFEFAKLWTKALRSILLALKDGGQLVLCLPERSHTGRQVQVFTQRGFVTHQILLLANTLDRELIRPADLVPWPGQMFRPPFYWESERALRRAILHFYVRVRPGFDRASR